MRSNNTSILDVLDMSEVDRGNLKFYLENMKTLGYRYIIYGKKVLDMNQASAYIQRYNVCKTSLTIEENELNGFYSEVETGSKLVTVLFLKDKLQKGK